MIPFYASKIFHLRSGTKSVFFQCYISLTNGRIDKKASRYEQKFSNEPLNITLKSSSSPLAPAFPLETWHQIAILSAI
jgi:hypothetical protein